MMKKFNYVLVAVAVICLATACKNKAPQTREEQIEEFRSMLTASDTTQMLQICDNAMELLKETETALWNHSNRRQRFYLKYWMCLHE